MFNRVRTLALILAIVASGFWFDSAEAEGLRTVYPDSGRYSLNIPADWIVGDASGFQAQSEYIGETLLVADSQAAMDAWEDTESQGQFLRVDVWSVASYSVFMAEDGTTYDLAGKSERELLDIVAENLSSEDVTPDYLEIQGRAAVRIRNDQPEEGSLESGTTAILADDLVYRMYYVGDMERLEAIADTFVIYSDAPATVNRPPFVLDNGVVTIPVEPGWLVMKLWSDMNPFGYAPVLMDQGTSSEQFYMIFPDHFETFLGMVYGGYSGRGSSLARLPEMPGWFVIVGVHPFDALYGNADRVLTSEQREEAFASIAGDLMLYYDEITTTESGIMRADLTRAMGEANQGSLMVMEGERKFYSILIIGPATAWDADMAAQFLDSIRVQVAQPRSEVPAGLQVGLRAPDFTLLLLDGSTVSLSDYQGKFVVLNFWATWCSPCRDEMEMLQPISEVREDVVILAVDFNEPEETVRSFAEEKGLTFPIALDVDGAVNTLYEVTMYPTTYIIAPDGIIAAMPRYLRNEDDLVDWLIRLQ